MLDIQEAECSSDKPGVTPYPPKDASPHHPCASPLVAVCQGTAIVSTHWNSLEYPCSTLR